MAGNMLNNPRPQFLDDNGDPFALGTLSFFDAAAHATPLDTHSDKELTVANANPVVLDAAGRPSSGGTEIAIFLKQQAYYVVLKDSLGNTIWDADDVSNILQVDLAGLATIATYAAARATVGATLTASERFFIETRTADGDDASGVFYWDATSTATDDDGTILKLADTATGRLLRDFSGAVSVKWFGATGDGVTDDTAAVAAAVATALNVLFPTGTYLVDNFASAGANQKFFGEGWQSIITHGAITGNLLDFTHAGITIRNLRLNGDGTFNQSAAVANNDRRALCKVTGDDFTSKDVLYNDGPQNCLHLDSMTGAKILKNKFIGGVATQTDTAYQGIRVTDCSDVTVDDNLFPGGANQYVIGIFFATFSSVNEDNTVTKNNVNGSFDNAIYLINAQGCTVTDNETTSDSSGVVVTGTSFVGGEVAGNICTGNICHASASVAAGTVGVYARDANNSIFNHNHTFDFPTGMQMAPVQHDNAGNEMSNNQMCHNVIKGWTVAGIKHFKGGLNLGDSSNNKFNDNTLIAGTATATSVAISANVAQQAAADIAFDNEYCRNTIIGSGDTGISLGFQQRFAVDWNKLTDAAIAGGTIKAAIYLPDCTEGSASENRIKDTVGAVLASGIDGNDTCTESDFYNNKIRGTATATPAIRRLQQAADKNSFGGNRTGADPLHGSVTMDADASTTVANDNINVGLGYTSFVILTPTNAAAATLIAGASSPYVRTADHVDRTSFFINTADAGNAAGTETYNYEILQ